MRSETATPVLAAPIIAEVFYLLSEASGRAYRRGLSGRAPMGAIGAIRACADAVAERVPADRENEVGLLVAEQLGRLLDAIGWSWGGTQTVTDGRLVWFQDAPPELGGREGDAAKMLGEEDEPRERNGRLLAADALCELFDALGATDHVEGWREGTADAWRAWQASDKGQDAREALWSSWLSPVSNEQPVAAYAYLAPIGNGEQRTFYSTPQRTPKVHRAVAEAVILRGARARTGFMPATVTLNGVQWAGVAKPVTAIAWSFGAPGEAVDVDGVMFAGSPATRYVPRMMDVTKGGAPAERTLALGLDDTPEPSGTHALALASSALVGGVASKLIILLHAMPEHREGTLGELTRVLMPKNTRYQQRDFERVAEALREVAGLMVYFPNEHTGVELFYMLRPTQSGISYADQRIWTGIHPALLAKLTAPANRWARGDVLINFDAMMGSPANETLERRVYLVAAGDINDANMKGAEVRHRPVNELVARANMRNRDASSKSMHEAREEVIAAAKSLAEKKLIELDIRGSHGRYEARLGPTAEHLEAYRKRREGGRR